MIKVVDSIFSERFRLPCAISGSGRKISPKTGGISGGSLLTGRHGKFDCVSWRVYRRGEVGRIGMCDSRTWAQVDLHTHNISLPRNPTSR